MVKHIEAQIAAATASKPAACTETSSRGRTSSTANASNQKPTPRAHKLTLYGGGPTALGHYLRLVGLTEAEKAEAADLLRKHFNDPL